MKTRIISSLILGSAAMLAVSSANAFTLNPIPAPTDQGAKMTEVLVGGNSDIIILPETIEYTGKYLYQGGYTSDGDIVLSTGPFMNHTPGQKSPGGAGGTADTGSNADLSGLIGGGATRDQNVLTFSFTVNDTSLNQISFDFVFASDEFSDFPMYQNNDVFGLFVDGVNYAFLPDGSVVSVKNAQSSYVDGKDYGYTGRTEKWTITALLDPNVEVHTISIAIADGYNIIGQASTSGDSTVFIGGMSLSSGIPVIPEPESWAMLLSGLGLVGITAKRRRRMK